MSYMVTVDGYWMDYVMSLRMRINHLYSAGGTKSCSISTNTEREIFLIFLHEVKTVLEAVLDFLLTSSSWSDYHRWALGRSGI